ncbi:MOSC domain-containing protein [Sphingoaurantiacus capsulatus]|uniref:MOSC domain-containing protein n=1 Tax=Sphingoaurantiacus capsulatus TaxID=1771310 RepID=A0ABV7XFD1_9SPHN
MASVVALHARSDVALSKLTQLTITLVAGHGVEGDRHSGPTRRHRARFRPTVEVPNLRQVHLIQSELFAELAAKGFAVAPGEMGENVTTVGIDLLALPVGARLRLGGDAVVELTGLRTPCFKLDRWQPGLKMATVERGVRNKITLKAGVMGIVVAGGEIRAGDAIMAEWPPLPHLPLKPV